MNYNQFQSGIVPSKYLANGFDDMSNVDILTEVGTARCNFNLIKESGTTVTEPVIICPTKTGDTYLFSTTSGKIWKRDVNGAYSLFGTNTHGKHFDAIFFDNWVYFSAQQDLGRFKADGSSLDWDYQKFEDNNALYHPMCALNDYLFIGDGPNLARLGKAHDDWTKYAIKLQTHSNIASIRPYGYDIAIFTNVISGMYQYLLSAGVYRYDTASISWSSEDYVDEKGMYVAIASNTSDEIFCLAGTNGDIYQFDGIRLQWFNKLKDVSSLVCHNRLNAAVGKRSFFSTGTGTIYSISHPTAGGPAVLNKEFVCSAGVTATINSMAGWGSQLLVSWTLDGVSGIDKIDTTYATATLDTPLTFIKARNVKVYYESLPTGTSIGISVKNDNGTWISKTARVDDIHKYVYLQAEPGNENYIQARVTLTPTTTATPIIQNIEITPY